MLGFLETSDRSRHQLRADKQAVWDRNAADLRAGATRAGDIICLTATCRITAQRLPCRGVRVGPGTYQRATELAEAIGKIQRMEIMK